MSKPAPPGWNKTIDDLYDEMDRGERLSVDSDEIDWARDYELSLLPSDTVFPRGGQVWEVIDQCEIRVNYVFAAPASFGGRSKLPPGEKVRIMKGSVYPKSTIVGFLPLRYIELHDSLVPADVRNTPRYTNYALSVKTAHFNQHFRLVEDVV